MSGRVQRFFLEYVYSCIVCTQTGLVPDQHLSMEDSITAGWAYTFVILARNPIQYACPMARQYFVHSMGNLGFPTSKLKSQVWPLKLCWLLAYNCITLPPQEHRVPYLAISKIIILYEKTAKIRVWSDPWDSCNCASPSFQCRILRIHKMNMQRSP